MVDAVELSKKLISCPSITPVDAGAIAVLEDELNALGFSCTRMSFEEEGTDEVDNLYAKYGEGEPNLCFAGHTDVVPTGDINLWSSHPFAPEIRDGKLYGRGTSDMKCAIACFVEAAALFIKDKKFSGSISLLITGDEEGISVNGTKKVLERLASQNEKITACIVGEPTSVDRAGDTIKIGRRGSVTFDLVVMGKQGHVAYPHLSDNPVTRIIRILHALKSHALDEGNDYFQPSNLEVVNIDVGNSADNVIPAAASARFNIRFNDMQNSSSLVKWIDSICSSTCEDGDATYSLKHRVSGEAFITEPGYLSDLVQKSVKDAYGFDAVLSTSGGTSDARFIRNYCPVVEIGTRNATAHKIDEHVDISEIVSLVKIYYNILTNFFVVFE